MAHHLMRAFNYDGRASISAAVDREGKRQPLHVKRKLVQLEVGGECTLKPHLGMYVIPNLKHVFVEDRPLLRIIEVDLVDVPFRARSESGLAIWAHGKLSAWYTKVWVQGAIRKAGTQQKAGQ